jgi:hypothetical protein
LVDTNVISELRKGERADAGVTRWFANVDDDAVYLSVLVIGELRKGIESLRRRDGRSAAVLEAWLQRVLADHGTRLLAATAHVHGLTLVTRNTSDMARTGVPVLNPFEAAQVR